MPNGQGQGLNFVYDLFCKMTRYDMNYLYHGSFSSNLTDGILSFAETAVGSTSESTKVRKKVYFIMVESLQNITRHQDSPLQGDADLSSFFIIQGINNAYFITSGNFISGENMKTLKSRLDMVNSLGPEELKAYSKELLEAGELSKKGGAGLGLIEMARKSGNKLAYDFQKLDEENYFFYYQIKVASADESPAVDEKYDDNFDNGKALHKLFADKKLSIVYQGGFSAENVQGVLSMIEQGFGERDSNFIRKTAYLVIVEMLHNIYRHAYSFEIDSESKPGIFMIATHKDEYVLSSGNLIANSHVESLKTKLEKVTALSAPEAEKQIKHLSRLGGYKAQAGHGTGLLDMNLKSNKHLVWDFIPVNAEYSFFVLQAKI
jgi:hypothetical protein